MTCRTLIIAAAGVAGATAVPTAARQADDCRIVQILPDGSRVEAESQRGSAAGSASASGRGGSSARSSVSVSSSSDGRSRSRVTSSTSTDGQGRTVTTTHDGERCTTTIDER